MASPMTAGKRTMDRTNGRVSSPSTPAADEREARSEDGEPDEDARNDPLHLLALDTGRAAEPEHHRREAAEKRDDGERKSGRLHRLDRRLHAPEAAIGLWYCLERRLSR